MVLRAAAWCFGYPTLCAKKEKKVLLVFQHLIVQRDLPGERQSGMAHGNPQFGPSQGMAAARGLLRRSCYTPFPLGLPYPG